MGRHLYKYKGHIETKAGINTLFTIASMVLVLTVVYNLYSQKQQALCQGTTCTQKKQEPRKPDYGCVMGIMYSQDNPSAVVDTNIVHQGDIIYNVKIKKITKDFVEFESNGRKWVQKVQQEPNLNWLENDPNTNSIQP